jgi:hypothetical protein
MRMTMRTKSRTKMMTMTFASLRVLNTVMFLEQKLDAEAEEREWKKLSLIAKEKRAALSKVKQPSQEEQRISEIRKLKSDTYAKQKELATRRQLDKEMLFNREASLALYRQSISPTEKREHDAHTERMSLWAAGVCKEASPNWREDAQAEFNRKKL